MGRRRRSDPGTQGLPRVLMLATRVPQTPGDGTPSFVLDGAIALSDRFDVTILAPRMKGTSRLTKHGEVTVVRFPYFPRIWERLADDAIVPQLQRDRRLWIQAMCLTLCMLAFAWSERRRLHPLIIHAHWIVPSGLVAGILKLSSRTPYILTSHGADAFVAAGGLLGRIKNFAVAGASRFVAVSQEISDQYAHVTDRRAVQPVGVDFKAWTHVRRTRSPEPGRVLFIGRLTEKKGVGVLLRSASFVPQISVRIAGNGPDVAQLLAISDDPNLKGRVHFLGQLTRQELEHELRLAAFIVIPSVIARNGDRDGTPTVLGEAVAAGVPVICSELAGLADYVEGGVSGLTVAPGDVEELAEALRQLSDHPSYAERIANAALEKLREVLDHSNAADRYELWYSEAYGTIE